LSDFLVLKKASAQWTELFKLLVPAVSITLHWYLISSVPSEN